MKYLLIAVFCLACTPDESLLTHLPKKDTAPVSIEYDSFLVYRIVQFYKTGGWEMQRVWIYKPKVVFTPYGHNLLWDTCGRYIKNSRKEYEKILDTSIWERTSYYSNCKGLINPKDW